MRTYIREYNYPLTQCFVPSLFRCPSVPRVLLHVTIVSTCSVSLDPTLRKQPCAFVSVTRRDNPPQPLPRTTPPALLNATPPGPPMAGPAHAEPSPAFIQPNASQQQWSTDDADSDIPDVYNIPMDLHIVFGSLSERSHRRQLFELIASGIAALLNVDTGRHMI